MYAAGLADTLGRTEERDRYLQSVIDALAKTERRPKPMIPTNCYQDSVVRNQRAMATLANLYQQAVAASPQALDERAVAELAGSLDRSGSDVYYVVALFFDARKQAPKAAGYLRLAAKTRLWNTDSSILASAALRDHGEEPPIPFPAVHPGAKQASTPLAPNPKPSPVPVANPGDQHRGAKAIQDSLDMARIYMNNGRREQAKAALQAAIKAHPDHPDAAKARQLLESLK